MVFERTTPEEPIAQLALGLTAGRPGSTRSSWQSCSTGAAPAGQPHRPPAARRPLHGNVIRPPIFSLELFRPKVNVSNGANRRRRGEGRI